MSILAVQAQADVDPAEAPGQRPCLAPAADPEWWFPGRGDVLGSRRAKQLCGQCPVIAECLTGALARNERFGVWGGLSERERRKLPRTHPCRRCADPAPLTDVYCGDDCRDSARRAGQARYDRNRKHRDAARRTS